MQKSIDLKSFQSETRDVLSGVLMSDLTKKLISSSQTSWLKIRRVFSIPADTEKDLIKCLQMELETWRYKVFSLTWDTLFCCALEWLWQPSCLSQDQTDLSWKFSKNIISFRSQEPCQIDQTCSLLASEIFSKILIDSESKSDITGTFSFLKVQNYQ